MPRIEVRNENADLMGHLEMDAEIDLRTHSLISLMIPVHGHLLFSQLVLHVQRVRGEHDHCLALRANSQDWEHLRRLSNFTPILS